MSESDGTTRTPELTPDVELSPREQAVYDVLAQHASRVLARRQIAQLARLGELSERRCDAIISALRRQIGGDRIVTVRRRGWMLVR